jgi:hypothetical protein
MESQKKTVDTLFKKQANCLILKNRTEVWGNASEVHAQTVGCLSNSSTSTRQTQEVLKFSHKFLLSYLTNTPCCD